MKLKINAIQHIGIPVTDIKKSEAFYQNLGFENVMSTTFESNKKTGLVAMMKSGTMIIELYQLPFDQLEDIRKRRDGHIDHIAFDVDDIELTMEILKKENFEIVEEKPIFLDFWNQGCKYFYIVGPDGERLEFNQII
jgi:catechol 2,3-dioxygenase-like lactoylglutathione lyase family enzyme